MAKENKVTVRGKRLYLNGVEVAEISGHRKYFSGWNHGPGYTIRIPALDWSGNFAYFDDAVKWGKAKIENALKQNKLEA